MVTIRESLASRELPPEWRARINVTMVWVAVLAASFLAATRFVVNDHDTRVFLQGGLEILSGDFVYEDYESVDLQPWEIPENPFGYMSPPHLPYLVLPFIVFGARWSAFWNLVFIFLLLVGDRSRLHPTLLRLIFLITAPLFFVAAAANITGIVTGIGLLILLHQRRGALRGIAWAFMLVRPQDTLLILIYEAFNGIRRRDWWAYIVCGALLMVPVFYYGPTIYLDWLESTARAGKSLSIADRVGIPAAIAFIALVLLLRTVNLRWFASRFHFQRRPFSAWTQTEFYWFLTMTLFMMGPYTTYYVLWMLLLPVREMRTGRVLAVFACITAVSIAFFRSRNHNDLILLGVALWIVFTALVMPRNAAEPPVALASPAA